MAGRGRGVPNLALAGMREESRTSNDNQTRGRGRGRGRGGRGGRGRGGAGAGKPKPELIQTMGVFSDGLHAEDRKKERVKLEFEGGSQKRIKEETTANTELTKAQVSSARGYAELWESDESGDEEELQDLLRDNFLNDAKSGRVLPLVTPIEEEAQFMKCMAVSTSVKKELMSDDEDEKPRISPVLNEEDSFPTLTRSKEAAEVVEKMMRCGSGDLLLLQIPSIVPILARATVEGRDPLADPAAPETPPCSSGLPRGHRVGLMKATADGGVELVIGGQRMSLTKNIGGATGYCDTLAMVEVPPSALISQESSGMFGGRMNANSSGASVSHLGNIKHHMVAALDWSASLANTHRSARNSKLNGDTMEMDMEWSSVKKEIVSPKKLDRDVLETRMDAVSKRRNDRTKFLAKWGTEL